MKIRYQPELDSLTTHSRECNSHNTHLEADNYKYDIKDYIRPQVTIRTYNGLLNRPLHVRMEAPIL